MKARNWMRLFEGVVVKFYDACKLRRDIIMIIIIIIIIIKRNFKASFVRYCHTSLPRR